ncbi:hypothetical protein AMTRI_Chr05g59360 [Amborella trichopoda]
MDLNLSESHFSIKYQVFQATPSNLKALLSAPMTNQDTCLNEWAFTSKINRRSHEKCWPGAFAHNPYSHDQSRHMPQWVFTSKIHRRCHETFCAFITFLLVLSLYLEWLHGPRSRCCQHRWPCQARGSSPPCPIELRCFFEGQYLGLPGHPLRPLPPLVL